VADFPSPFTRSPRFSLRTDVLYGRPISAIGMHAAVLSCTEAVLKIMDAGYCLYVHIFVFF